MNKYKTCHNFGTKLLMETVLVIKPGLRKSFWDHTLSCIFLYIYFFDHSWHCSFHVVHNDNAVAQLVTCHPAGVQPLSEPMMIHFIDAYERRTHVSIYQLMTDNDQRWEPSFCFLNKIPAYIYTILQYKEISIKRVTVCKKIQTWAAFTYMNTYIS